MAKIVYVHVQFPFIVFCFSMTRKVLIDIKCLLVIAGIIVKHSFSLKLQTKKILALLSEIFNILIIKC